MRRTNTQDGAKFTVRGQRYIQTGSFWHTMPSDREVRVLELKTDCPECGDAFEVTASLRQIEARILNRRCPHCRKVHSGPVALDAVKRMDVIKGKERRRRKILLHREERRRAIAAERVRVRKEAKADRAARRAAVAAAASASPRGRHEAPALAAATPARPAAAPSGMLPVLSARDDRFDAYAEILGLVD